MFKSNLNNFMKNIGAKLGANWIRHRSNRRICSYGWGSNA